MKRCRHVQSKIAWLTDEHLSHLFARHCADCGERLSLGPSNDEPAEVQIEIRAAELIQCRVMNVDYAFMTPTEMDGLHGIHPVDDSSWFSGAILIEWIIAGDLGLGLEDVNAWSWDPSRPVAGQYEEWEAENRRLDAINNGGALHDAIAETERRHRMSRDAHLELATQRVHAKVDREAAVAADGENFDLGGES